MKKETVAEFLARGGKITKVPSVEPTTKVETVKTTVVSNGISIMSLDEADLYHGEAKKNKAKRKPILPTIDISALPEALRKKYIDEVINEQNQDQDDEE